MNARCISLLYVKWPWGEEVKQCTNLDAEFNECKYIGQETNCPLYKSLEDIEK